MPRLIFTCRGYDFYRDDFAFWNVAPAGGRAPGHCAYATPQAVAKLKGFDSAALQALETLAWARLPD